MISDYQESAPKGKKFSANEIDNLYDDLILKFPDLKYVGSLINMTELDISFTPQGPTSRRINELQTNHANLMQRMEKLTPDYLCIRWNR